MIRAFVPLAVLLIPASVQSALLTAPVCGTDASGSPLLCGAGGSALMAYKTTGGHLYIVDIFGSGAGKRTIIAWRKVS